MAARPLDVLGVTDLEEQVQVLLKEGVVVLQPQTEERKRVDEGSAADHHLGPACRQQVERRELLKEPDGVDRAQDRDGAREPDATGAGRGRRQNHGRSRVQVLPAVMFADAERIEARLVCEFDLLDQLAQTVRWGGRETRVGVCRGEAVDAYRSEEHTSELQS